MGLRNHAGVKSKEVVIDEEGMWRLLLFLPSTLSLGIPTCCYQYGFGYVHVSITVVVMLSAKY